MAVLNIHTGVGRAQLYHRRSAYRVYLDLMAKYDVSTAK
jgi:hypothetical protein